MIIVTAIKPMLPIIGVAACCWCLLKLSSWGYRLYKRMLRGY